MCFWNVVLRPEDWTIPFQLISPISPHSTCKFPVCSIYFPYISHICSHIVSLYFHYISIHVPHMSLKNVLYSFALLSLYLLYLLYIYIYVHMVVSINGVSLKWMVYNGNSNFNRWYHGVPQFFRKLPCVCVCMFSLCFPIFSHVFSLCFPHMFPYSLPIL